MYQLDEKNLRPLRNDVPARARARCFLRGETCRADLSIIFSPAQEDGFITVLGGRSESVDACAVPRRYWPCSPRRWRHRSGSPPPVLRTPCTVGSSRTKSLWGKTTNAKLVCLPPAPRQVFCVYRYRRFCGFFGDVYPLACSRRAVPVFGRTKFSQFLRPELLMLTLQRAYNIATIFCCDQFIAV